jgi:lysozyme
MTHYDLDALKRELRRDEGERMTPYRDSLGYWTVGVGHLLTRNELERFVDPATGKTRKAITESECADLLLGDIINAENNLNRIAPGWRGLDDVRQRAILNLSFNLGPRLNKFVGFLRCVEDGLWEAAASNLKNSRWWGQVKSRGPRIAHMILTGTPWAGE